MNAALAPSELRTLAELSAAGLLHPYEHAVPVWLTHVACAAVFEAHVPRLFHSRMPSPHNADEVALFPALSLDDAGHPLPVVHSAFAFALLFGAPAPERWSWNRADGRDVLHSFGPLSSTADGSDAAQLWSCVYIAVRPPRESTS